MIDLQRFAIDINEQKNILLLIRSANTRILKRTKDRGLSVAERIGTARNVQLREKKDELVKDLFVFSCFTGLSYSDMKRT